MSILAVWICFFLCWGGGCSRHTRKIHSTKTLNHIPGHFIAQLRQECTHATFHVHMSKVNDARRRVAKNHVATEGGVAAREGWSAPLLTVSHNFTLIHAVALRDPHPAARSGAAADLMTLPCVLHVTRDMRLTTRLALAPHATENTGARVTEAPPLPWGLDRLDQRTLPLNGRFLSGGFTGAGVDVYLLDTGLDTTHEEFRQQGEGAAREVRNIFDGFAAGEHAQQNPPPDTDGNGHGTHTAGTVGGRRVGVAPGASLFMSKILNDAGEGSTAVVLAALEQVRRRVLARARRAVLSMSLGGDCDGGRTAQACTRDPIVLAVEQLAALGVVASVAAGNSRANACHGSPNSAPSALNVGATNSKDQTAYFSNIGTCVDLLAPGEEVLSAAASTLSGRHDAYHALSGTSMAAPHVSGVLALQLQRDPSLTVAEAVARVLCEAVPLGLRMDPLDARTRNLLLQAPGPDSPLSHEACAALLGGSCPLQCSGEGVCMPYRRLSYSAPQEQQGGEQLVCFCNGGHYGEDCGSSTPPDPSCHAQQSHEVAITMLDAYGDGWNFASYAMVDAGGGVAALDSMEDGASRTQLHCLPAGRYQLRVEQGDVPAESEWHLCGAKGGLPYSGFFEVTDALQSSGWHCRMVCGLEDGGPARPLQSLLMLSGEGEGEGEGWQGAYYQVFDLAGALLFGGTLLEGSSGRHDLCLPPGGSVLRMPPVESVPVAAVRYEVCGGFQGDPRSLAQLSLDAITGQCSATDVTRPSAAPPCRSGFVSHALVMLDFRNSTEEVDEEVEPQAPRLFSLRISASANSSGQVAQHRLQNQFMGSFNMCLPDQGCFDITFETAGISFLRHMQFSLCGQVADARRPLRFCVEREHNLCYGLTGCPVLVSHAQRSSLQHFFLYAPYADVGDDDQAAAPGGGLFVAQKVERNGNLHGVHELCGLRHGLRYSLLLGAGKRTGDTVKFCDHPVTLPATVQFEVSNETECRVLEVKTGSCTDAGQRAFLLVLLDAFGDGWGSSTYSVTELSGGRAVAAGSLPEGQLASEVMCLRPGSTYRLHVLGEAYEEEVKWMLCGYVGTGAADLEFAVLPDGVSCLVLGVSEDGYSQTQDDDFPSPSPPPTRSLPAPSSAPSPSPGGSQGTSRPSSRGSSGLPPWLLEDDDDRAVRPKYLSTIVYSQLLCTSVRLVLLLHTVSLASSVRPGDVAFVPLAVRKVLVDAGFAVWNVELISFTVAEEKWDDGSAAVSFLLDTMFRVSVRVPHFEQNALALKERLGVGLLAARASEHLDLVLRGAHAAQMGTSQPAGVTRDMTARLLQMGGGRADKVVVTASPHSPFEVTEPGLLAFLRSDQFFTSAPTTEVRVQHHLTHLHVALVVFTLTLVALLGAYACFLAKSCRARTSRLAEGVVQRVKQLEPPSSTSLLAGVRRSIRAAAARRQRRGHRSSDGSRSSNGDCDYDDDYDGDNDDAEDRDREGGRSHDDDNNFICDQDIIAAF